MALAQRPVQVPGGEDVPQLRAGGQHPDLKGRPAGQEDQHGRSAAGNPDLYSLYLLSAYIRSPLIPTHTYIHTYIQYPIGPPLIQVYIHTYIHTYICTVTRFHYVHIHSCTCT